MSNSQTCSTTPLSSSGASAPPPPKDSINANNLHSNITLRSSSNLLKVAILNSAFKQRASLPLSCLLNPHQSSDDSSTLPSPNLNYLKLMHPLIKIKASSPVLDAVEIMARERVHRVMVIDDNDDDDDDDHEYPHSLHSSSKHDTISTDQPLKSPIKEKFVGVISESSVARLIISTFHHEHDGPKTLSLQVKIQDAWPLGVETLQDLGCFYKNCVAEQQQQLADSVANTSKLHKSNQALIFVMEDDSVLTALHKMHHHSISSIPIVRKVSKLKISLQIPPSERDYGRCSFTAASDTSQIMESNLILVGCISMSDIKDFFAMDSKNSTPVSHLHDSVFSFFKHIRMHQGAYTFSSGRKENHHHQKQHQKEVSVMEEEKEKQKQKQNQNQHSGDHSQAVQMSSYWGDRVPVFWVDDSTTLLNAMEKMIVLGTHRVWIQKSGMRDNTTAATAADNDPSLMRLVGVLSLSDVMQLLLLGKTIPKEE